MTDEQETAWTNKHIGSSFGDFDAEQAAISQVCKWLLEQGYSIKPRDPAEQWEGIDGLLHFFVAQIAETARPKRCRWVNDDPGCWNSWETDCNGLFQILEGTPEQNGMKYCPYCGGELVTDEK